MRLTRLSVVPLAALLAACSAFPAAMGPLDGVGSAIGLQTASKVDAVRALGKLAGEVRSPIVAAGGLNLVARGGGHILEANGRKMVAAGGGNIVGNHGGQIIAAGGMNDNGKTGGIVAAGGLNYALLLVVDDDLAEVPVAGATVFLRDALTLAVVADVAPTTTDEAGAFTFTDVPLDSTYVVEAIALGESGDGVRLTAVARALANDAPRSPVAVTVASTLVAARVAETTEERRGGVYALEPGAVADAVQAVHDQLKGDRVELRDAAKGLRVKTTGTVGEATVAADYEPKEFAPSANASARAEAKLASTRARVGKVRKAIDPAIDVPDVAAAAGTGGKSGGSGGGSEKKPTGGASTAPTTDASAPPTTDPTGVPAKEPGAATGGTTTGKTTSGGTSTGGATSTGGTPSGGKASGGSSSGSSGGSSGGSKGGKSK